MSRVERHWHRAFVTPELWEEVSEANLVSGPGEQNRETFRSRASNVSLKKKKEKQKSEK